MAQKTKEAKGDIATQKGYKVKTYGVTPDSLKKFEKTYEDFRRFAIAKGIKPPSKSDLVSRLFEISGKVISVKDFFPNGVH